MVFEALDPNMEWYLEVAAAVQKAIRCYCVIYDEKKWATTQISLYHFFKRVGRIELSRGSEPVPSTSGMSEIAVPLHLLLLTILQLHHLPPLPPPVSNSPCLFTWCQPRIPAVPLYFSRSCTVRWKTFSLFFVLIVNVLFVWEGR